MPGRDRCGREHWSGAAGRRPATPDRAADREPGRRADYHTEQGLTPEDREAAGEAIGDDGEATGRKRPAGRDDPGAWFGRPPPSPRPRRSLTDRRSKD